MDTAYCNKERAKLVALEKDYITVNLDLGEFDLSKLDLSSDKTADSWLLERIQYLCEKYKGIKTLKAPSSVSAITDPGVQEVLEWLASPDNGPSLRSLNCDGRVIDFTNTDVLNFKDLNEVSIQGSCALTDDDLMNLGKLSVLTTLLINLKGINGALFEPKDSFAHLTSLDILSCADFNPTALQHIGTNNKLECLLFMYDSSWSKLTDNDTIGDISRKTAIIDLIRRSSLKEITVSFPPQGNKDGELRHSTSEETKDLFEQIGACKTLRSLAFWGIRGGSNTSSVTKMLKRLGSLETLIIEFDSSVSLEMDQQEELMPHTNSSKDQPSQFYFETWYKNIGTEGKLKELMLLSCHFITNNLLLEIVNRSPFMTGLFIENDKLTNDVINEIAESSSSIKYLSIQSTLITDEAIPDLLKLKLHGSRPVGSAVTSYACLMFYTT